MLPYNIRDRLPRPFRTGHLSPMKRPGSPQDSPSSPSTNTSSSQPRNHDLELELKLDPKAQIPYAKMATHHNPLPISELFQEKVPPTPAPTSPQRPRHLTTRSITEISPPSGQKSKLHSRHNHHRHPHIHKHHHSRGGADKGSGQETEAAVSLAERGTRSEGVTPDESRNASRRGSVFGVGVVGPGDGVGERERVVREGEVAEERERGVLRATGLRNALTDLNILSNTTTRKLDNTYYAVLEKLSTLQNTISSMQELATMTRQLKQEFEQEAGDIVQDVTMQLNAFAGFEEQEKRIEKLAGRVHAGRETIKALGGRVNAVKYRVEGWEEAEKEWKDKTRMRLKVMWIVMAVFGGLFFIGVLVQRFAPTRTAFGGEEGDVVGFNSSGLLGRRPDIEMKGNESRANKHAGRVLEKLREGELRREEDMRLRVFDEL